MGFNDNNFPAFEKFLKTQGLNEKDLVITELGAQQSWMKRNDVFPPKRYFSLWFKDRFKKINSLDLVQEHDQVIKVDLREPMEAQQAEELKADIVMNVGTTEHVSSLQGQYTAWWNLHHLCKLGGYMIHELPEKGSWKNHPCCFWYDEKFFKGLAEANQYEIIELTQHHTKGQGNLVWCVFKMEYAIQFMNYDDFIELLK